MLYKILFLVLFAMAARAQPADTVVTMKKKTVVNVANKFRALVFQVDTLNDRARLDDSLFAAQAAQIADLKAQTVDRDSIIAAQREQILVYKTNEDLHAQTEQALRRQLQTRSASLFSNWIPPAIAGVVVGFVLFHK